MKITLRLTALAVLIGLALAFPALAQEGSGSKGEGEVPAAEESLWMTDFEAAKASAKEAGKDLLVNFSGSDWCGWCMKLDSEVLSQASFLDEAKKKFVLCNLDFPRQKPNPDKEKNNKVSRAYGVGSFPTVLLLDSQGKVYGSTGYQKGGPESYLTHLATFREQIPQRDQLLGTLDTASGDDLTAAIKAAVEKLREWKILAGLGDEVTAAMVKKVDSVEGAEGQARELGAFLTLLKGDYKGHGTNLARFGTLVEKAVALDPEGKFGLKLDYLDDAFQIAKMDKNEEAAAKYAALITEADPKNEHGLAEVVLLSDVEKLFQDKKFADVARKVEEFLSANTPKDRGDILYWAAGVAHYQNKETEKALPFMKKIVELYPSSRFARMAGNFLKKFGGK